MRRDMDVYQCILTRRSVRSFLNKEVSEEALTKILEAGRWAPSASNRQPWQFIIIRNKDLLTKISEHAKYGRFVSQAPVAVAVVTDPSNNWHAIDGSTAVQNMALAAWEMGIGTCWIGAMERDEVKKILGIPENLHLLTVLPFGYPASVGTSQRRDMASMLHVNRWQPQGES